MPPTTVFTGSRIALSPKPDPASVEQGPVPAHLLPPSKRPTAARTDSWDEDGEDIPVPVRRKKVEAPKPAPAPRLPREPKRRHPRPEPQAVPAPAPPPPPVSESVNAQILAELESLRIVLDNVVADLRLRAGQVDAALAQINRMLTMVPSPPPPEPAPIKTKYTITEEHRQRIREAQARRTTEERRESARKAHDRRRAGTG